VAESLARRLIGSHDRVLDAIGVALLWATTGADVGLDKIHGLRPILDEETSRANGIPLNPEAQEKLRIYIAASGGASEAARRSGVHPLTLTRAATGGRVKLRVYRAILLALAGRENRRGKPLFERLSADEIDALRNAMAGFDSTTDAANACGVTVADLGRAT